MSYSRSTSRILEFDLKLIESSLSLGNLSGQVQVSKHTAEAAHELNRIQVKLISNRVRI